MLPQGMGGKRRGAVSGGGGRLADKAMSIIKNE